MPTSAHQHVRQENQIAGEMHEHPFAVRFYFLDSSARERSVEVDARKLGQLGFKSRDELASQRLV